MRCRCLLCGERESPGSFTTRLSPPRFCFLETGGTFVRFLSPLGALSVGILTAYPLKKGLITSNRDSSPGVTTTVIARLGDWLPHAAPESSDPAPARRPPVTATYLTSGRPIRIACPTSRKAVSPMLCSRLDANAPWQTPGTIRCKLLDGVRPSRTTPASTPARRRARQDQKCPAIVHQR